MIQQQSPELKSDIKSCDPRVLLATERTFLAWIRTSVGFVALGFVVAKYGLFLRQMNEFGSNAKGVSSNFSLHIGVGLIGFGMASAFFATIRMKKAVSAIIRGDFPSEFNITFLYLFSLSFILLSLVLALVVIMA